MALHPKPKHMELKREFMRMGYHKLYGTWPTNGFFCPMLNDWSLETCEGHINPECLNKISAGTVVQDKCVDNWFGSVIEARASYHSAGAGENRRKFDGGELTQKQEKQVSRNLHVVSEEFEHRLSISRSPNSGAGLLEVCYRGSHQTNREFKIECRPPEHADNALIVSILRSSYLALFRHIHYNVMQLPGAIVIGCLLRAMYLHDLPKVITDEGEEEILPFANRLIRPCANKGSLQGTATNATIVADTDTQDWFVFVTYDDKMWAVRYPNGLSTRNHQGNPRLLVLDAPNGGFGVFPVRLEGPAPWQRCGPRAKLTWLD